MSLYAERLSDAATTQQAEPAALPQFGERRQEKNTAQPVPGLPEAGTDIMTPKARKKIAAKAGRRKESMLRTYLFLFALGFVAMIYITHIFATEKLLQQVSAAEQELERVQMIHDARMLRYEQLTGPSAVFERATELGFEHAGPADYVIERGR
ncbi:hypothetical protein CYPRO_1076 [Cyclonatronum proteinivorum]|uniref:Cell division protein FtsL n=1 Tax=Cyclonatronum proteinivorum TaxID=1457365 RepID=A0A345UIN9_9BACT|nr:hypothetical protein [Cyclonatronum proteinivorum]AXJ00341.1 hypothetical protein CYPRO_1076 [Cyclonatronum proteinivorum]